MQNIACLLVAGLSFGISLLLYGLTLSRRSKKKRPARQQRAGHVPPFVDNWWDQDVDGWTNGDYVCAADLLDELFE